MKIWKKPLFAHFELIKLYFNFDWLLVVVVFVDYTKENELFPQKPSDKAMKTLCILNWLQLNWIALWWCGILWEPRNNTHALLFSSHLFEATKNYIKVDLITTECQIIIFGYFNQKKEENLVLVLILVGCRFNVFGGSNSNGRLTIIMMQSLFFSSSSSFLS